MWDVRRSCFEGQGTLTALPCGTAAGDDDVELIPRWAFIFHGFALFAYQTLDNMDGKQVGG